MVARDGRGGKTEGIKEGENKRGNGWRGGEERKRRKEEEKESIRRREKKGAERKGE